MKILLINPQWSRYVSTKGHRINRPWPPLDLLNIAAFLEKQGHSCALLDARARPIALDQMAAQARQADLVFITSSPLDRWQCPNLEIDVFIEHLRALKGCRTVLLGVHGTHFPEHFLKESVVEAVILGEPELAAAAIGEGKPYAQVPGVVWRSPEGTKRNPPAPMADLTQYPVPAFHLLTPDDYHYELMGERFYLLETTRGCPFPCTFCQRDLYGGRAYRYKTAAQVVRDVEAALAAGMKTGYFIDLEFSLNRTYTIEVCKALMPYRDRWTWCVQTRADSVDPELLKAMFDAGCRLVHIGVETGSVALLEKVQKKITHEQILEGLEMIHASGMESACFLMAGLPEETAADRAATLAFAKKANPTYASFHLTSPYPGTPLYEQRIGTEMYPESFYAGKELEEIRRWEKKAFYEYYCRPTYVLQLLRRGGLSRLWRQLRLWWQMA